MNALPEKLKITHKLVVITLISIAGMFITLSLFYQELVSSLTQEKKLQSQILSKTGLNIIKHFYSLVSNGDLKESDAKSLVMNALQSIILKDNGYYWIQDDSCLLLMHPYVLKLVGRNLYDFTDKRGDYIFREFVEVAKKGGGFVEYYWSKPNSKGLYLKVSYITYFKPWDWVLGTGLYIDDMELEVRSYTLRVMGVIVIFTIIMVLLSLWLTKKFMRQLEAMAIRDPLTSLYTRRYLDENMENLMLKYYRNKNNYLSVVFLDIDFFKKVNDTHGHLYGDEVLLIISDIIMKNSRPDDFCVRYGGEEFVVIVLSEDKETALHVTERICAKFNEEVFTKNGEDFSITLSAGLATHKENELLDDTLHRADINLYKAKAKGRNCIVT